MPLPGCAPQAEAEAANEPEKAAAGEAKPGASAAAHKPGEPAAGGDKDKGEEGKGLEDKPVGGAEGGQGRCRRGGVGTRRLKQASSMAAPSVPFSLRPHAAVPASVLHSSHGESCLC
jgi:hypothetical protein